MYTNWATNRLTKRPTTSGSNSNRRYERKWRRYFIKGRGLEQVDYLRSGLLAFNHSVDNLHIVANDLPELHDTKQMGKISAELGELVAGAKSCDRRQMTVFKSLVGTASHYKPALLLLLLLWSNTLIRTL